MTKRWSLLDRRFNLAGLAWLCSAGLASAQNLAPIIPQQPAAKSAPAVAPPAGAQPPAAAADKVILPALKGIRLVGAPAGVVRNGVNEPGVTIVDLPHLDDPEIRATLSQYLNHPLTLASLHAMTRAIIDWYRAHDLPFTDAFAPEQNITTGTVQIVVTEFHVGKVTVSGNKWFSAAAIENQFGVNPGDPIEESTIRADLDYINENPFHQVTAKFQPGAGYGASDLGLAVQDEFPFRVYAGYDNSGQPITGHDRWNVGFNWGDALVPGGRLNYQLTTSDDFWHSREFTPGGSGGPSFMANSLDYIVPLPLRTELEFIGAYVQQVPRLGPDLGETGTSGQASLRYTAHLTAPSWLTPLAQLGYDFKTTNNNLEFGGATVTSGTTEIDQFLANYVATATDPFGKTGLVNSLVVSPGGLTANNNTAAFQPSPTHAGVAFASAHYVYDRIELTRTTALPYDTSWVERLQTQFSDHNLLPSEQLDAGGINNMRGYDDYAASGTLGIIVNSELRSPPFSLARLAHVSAPFEEQAQLDMFFDYADVYDKALIPGAPSSVQLASTGMGLRYALARYLDFRLEFGWQLRKAPGASERAEFGQLTATVSY